MPRHTSRKRIARARIIPPMRRGLSLFLVLLLVLRGLLGDAMAMEQATPAAPAHHTMLAAAPQDGLHPAMDPHAHGEHAPRDAPTAPQPPSADACAPDPASPGCHHGHEGMASCSACGICHSALSQPHLPEPPPAQAPTTLRPHGAARFASAPTALLIKPPIS